MGTSGDSGSTPTPSTNVDGNHQQQNGQAAFTDGLNIQGKRTV